jgi:hypothetical protein
MKNCAQCQGTGFIIVETGILSAAKPCACRQPNTSTGSSGTLLTDEVASIAANMLCDTLAFSPTTELGRATIAKALMKTCHSQEEVLWVVERACDLHTRWTTCGIPGLRQILSSRCIPKDGVPLSSTQAYPDGIPSEHSQQELDRVSLPPGQAISIDPNLERSVHELAEAKSFPRATLPRVTRPHVRPASSKAGFPAYYAG